MAQDFRPRPENLLSRTMKHPFFAWMGLRPPIAQHTEAEHRALEKYANGCKSLVEIGVAEGASAIALRDTMNAEGTLYLIDPFHLSRVKTLNFLRRAAHQAVCGKAGPKVVWLESFSHEAACGWNQPIDFLLIDGDHHEKAVEQDWNDWSPYITPSGAVAFHDAGLFPRGWTSDDHGPVRFVNRKFRQGASVPWTVWEQVDSLVIVRRSSGE